MSAQNFDSELIAGRFRKLRVLGEGGMGIVYLGEHVKLGNRVAIKLLHPNHQISPSQGKEESYRQRLERLSREAQTYAKINHPNLVTLHDYERQPNGQTAIILEYVQGLSLDRFLREHETIPIPVAIDIVSQIAQGLHAAHKQGIIHRDLKPQNVMLTPTTDDHRAYHVKLLDFGIAKDTRSDAEAITRNDMICGTPEYISPEQVKGTELTTSCDLYSLGIVFYELLTKELPFQHKNPLVLIRMHEEQSPPLLNGKCHHPEGFPEALEKIVMTCLAKNPRDRYSSVSKFLKALDNFSEEHYGQQLPNRYLAMSPFTSSRPPRTVPTPELGAAQQESTRSAFMSRLIELRQELLEQPKVFLMTVSALVLLTLCAIFFHSEPHVGEPLLPGGTTSSMQPQYPSAHGGRKPLQTRRTHEPSSRTRRETQALLPRVPAPAPREVNRRAAVTPVTRVQTSAVSQRDQDRFNLRLDHAQRVADQRARLAAAERRRQEERQRGAEQVERAKEALSRGHAERTIELLSRLRPLEAEGQEVLRLARRMQRVRALVQSGDCSSAHRQLERSTVDLEERTALRLQRHYLGSACPALTMND